MNRISAVGAGNVALTTAACLADLGNHVGLVDIDDEKIRTFTAIVCFFEPGLQELGC